ncbi:MAG: 23S rRNA (guanosine(2251)-2'-O)-methyltransferase RlmB [Clostridia bacterium]|nr:23S rRNA (guanosine(2251)-2'-O)-methyltransferase RlmB [Clostridia bacterium]
MKCKRRKSMKVEGRNAVFELLKTDKTVDKLLVENGQKDDACRRILALAKDKKIKVQFLDRTALYKESETGRCQGFIAYTTDYEYADLADILSATEEKDGFIVLLAGVEDPHNLGSVIRVCECAGVDGIIIPARRAATVTDNVLRISEGAANHMKIARVTNVNAAIDTLKDAGYWITGAELGGEDIYRADLTGKLCVVIGGEDTGIPRLTKEKCDRVVTLPVMGKVNSLNASVACGIVVYEALRQRRAKK